jgi:hypothetical protein
MGKEQQFFHILYYHTAFPKRVPINLCAWLESCWLLVQALQKNTIYGGRADRANPCIRRSCTSGRRRRPGSVPRVAAAPTPPPAGRPTCQRSSRRPRGRTRARRSAPRPLARRQDRPSSLQRATVDLQGPRQRLPSARRAARRRQSRSTRPRC